jgi:hypothetical protein
MKSITSLATLAAILVAGSLAQAQIVIVSDNFDSYTPGVIADNSNFPSAIPSYSGTWFRQGGGVAGIKDATPYGRTGQVFEYSENGGAGQFPQARLNLASAYSGTETWTQSVDFYVDILPGSTYSVLTANNASNRLASIGLFTSGLNVRAFFVASTGSAGGGTVADNFTGNLSLDTWYTATISGNNVTKLVTASITTLTAPVGTYYYNTNVTSLSRVIIGDNNSGVGTSTVLLDNFSLSFVPEPGSFTLILGAGLAFLYRWRSRASRQA